MPMMLGRLYAALRKANVPEDEAREASEEVAGYETRLTKVESDLSVLKWMVAANIGLTATILLLK